mgnify:CR=1 FL=1
MSGKKINLHNHTQFSDGGYSPEEIVNAAVQARLDDVGISDHFYTQKVFHGLSLEVYLGSVWQEYLKFARRTQQIPNPAIKVWVGIEIDSCFRRVGKTLEALPWNEINTLDYVLMEYIGETDGGGLPISELGKLRALCQIPLVLAHPNIEHLTETVPLHGLVEVLRMHRIALEIPGGSRNHWYWNEFDPTPLSRLSLTIGTDTHEDITQVGAVDKALAFLQKHSLEKNLGDPGSLNTRTGGAS